MFVRLEVTYKTKKGTEVMFTSDEMNAEKALLIAEDLEKTGRLKDLVFIDHYDTTLTMKELKRYTEEIKTEPHNITVYFDGGFDLKTKMSGLGCVIYYDQNGKSFRQRKNRLVEALDTNNEAEYAALHFAIQELEELGVHHLPVKFVGDSQVVINQLNEEWPVMEDVLNSWADRVEENLEALGITPEYTVVPRKNNQEADRLATQALEETEIMSTVEIVSEE
ncbi:reverse transcriptase-like protein [Texcoconibacillus texcoconensis]|uniref:Ribonuclease HI n=1 Tax=Texcoconibacillus texcoconensis TaxID=1095777 RepID=A0A840QUY1_9BACI|nr:reverse transcriptase-like protein [Texcoconibacillus texcoconensis]MBB5175079.1 ribonuclease HI [Texcoconibacillus texcoconensis]